jgi:hypothetical protein
MDPQTDTTDSNPLIEAIAKAHGELAEREREAAQAATHLEDAEATVRRAEDDYAEAPSQPALRKVEAARSSVVGLELIHRRAVRRMDDARQAVAEAERVELQARFEDACARASEGSFLDAARPGLEGVVNALRTLIDARDQLDAALERVALARAEAVALAGKLGTSNTPKAIPSDRGLFLLQRVVFEALPWTVSDQGIPVPNDGKIPPFVLVQPRPPAERIQRISMYAPAERESEAERALLESIVPRAEQPRAFTPDDEAEDEPRSWADVACGAHADDLRRAEERGGA